MQNLENNMEIVTFSVRLNPTYSQILQLNNLIKLRNSLYNKLLAYKQDLYQVSKYNISRFDLDAYIPILTDDFPELKNIHSKSAQVISRQIDSSFKSFFALRKEGDFKAKPPGFVNIDKSTSVTYNQSGWKLKNNTIKISKIDNIIEFFPGRKNFDNANVKEITIKKHGNKWICDLKIQKDIKISKSKIQQLKGTVVLDLGVKKLATGVDSNGKTIVIINKAKKKTKYFAKQIKIVNKKLETKSKDSRQYNRLKVVRTKLYRKQKIQVDEALHIQSKKLVDMNYQKIIFGDLSVKLLMQRDNNKKKGVRKSLHQSSISTFLEFIERKAIRKGIVVYKVDERGTSQTNCLTMEKFPKRVDLDDRELRITDNILIERDLCSSITMYRIISEGWLYKSGTWIKSSENLVELTPPLNVMGVLEENNLFKKEVPLGPRVERGFVI